MEKTEKMQKVVIKVLKEGQIQWVHFSNIPKKLYKNFFKVTGSEPADLNKYLSEWCKDDFEVRLRMYKFDDIFHLKKAIIERYEAEYTELFNNQSKMFIRGWVKMWLCNHMREEITRCREKAKNSES